MNDTFASASSRRLLDHRRLWDTMRSRSGVATPAPRGVHILAG